MLLTSTLLSAFLFLAPAPFLRTNAFESDRQAILAMRGEYQVGFHFQETVVLAPGYQPKPVQDSRGYEAVVLVEDTGNRIVLQHLLIVSGGHVVKHWRQDWVYEAPTRFEFVADQTWRVRKLTEDATRGKWTQCVFEVNDAPRYCGTGTWNHRYGVSTWMSDRTFRPLPRREHTTRSDYNALDGRNRHTITPDGWTHEQDNTKTKRKGEQVTGALVREFGFNNYRRVAGHDFQPAYDYWKKTDAFWAKVRQRWNATLAGEGLTLKTNVDGMPLIQALATLAAKAEHGDDVAKSDLDAVFSQYVSPLQR